MESVIQKTHIQFVFCGPSDSGKTVIWDVNTKDRTEWLGTITWFGRWRCYSFNAAPATVFEKTCLREIADFCEVLTNTHRLDARRRKAESKTEKLKE